MKKKVDPEYSEIILSPEDIETLRIVLSHAISDMAHLNKEYLPAKIARQRIYAVLALL